MKMQSGGQRYHSIGDSEGVAASSGDASLPETLELVADVPNCTVSKYCTRYERMLDARRFAEMFSDGRRKMMVDRHSMRHDTDICAWERRLSSMRQECACKFIPAGSFDMPFILYVDEFE